MKHVIALLLWFCWWCNIACCLVVIPSWRRKAIGVVSRHCQLFALQKTVQSQAGDAKDNPPGKRKNKTRSDHRHDDVRKTKQRTKYRFSRRRRRQQEFESLLRDFQSPEEIDLWMKDLVESPGDATDVASEERSDNLPTLPSSWSSRDECDFIRYLRDRGAFQALGLYACSNLARKNVFIFTAAISSLASSSSKETRQTALIILDRMDKANVLPSSVTFAALFKSVDGPDEARKLMSRLQQNYNKKIAWSLKAFHQAILACARSSSRDPQQQQQQRPTSKSWQVALEFRQILMRQQQGLSPNLKTYSSLLYVCAQTGQLRIALSLVREIENNPSLPAPNAGIWCQLLNVCAQAGDYKQANECLKSMRRNGMRINLANCSALLKALSRYGKAGLSFQVLDMMTGSTDYASKTLLQQRHHESNDLQQQLVSLPPTHPDLVALNTVLASCAKARDVDAFPSARQLLNDMRDGQFRAAKTYEPIYPDEISYNLLLSACRDPLAAKEIVKEMQLSRRYRLGVVRPNSVTYTRAIAVCRKADVPDVESAQFFLSSARADGLKPTVYMYTAAIWTAEKCGNYSFAKETLGVMKDENVTANSISYTGVISAAARAGYVNEAFAVYEEMRSAGCLPSAGTYNALTLAARNSQPAIRLEKLKAIFETMHERDRVVAVGGSLIEVLIAEYGRRGAYSDAKRAFDSIEGPSDGSCLRAILSACATAEPEPKWEEAVSILHSSDITVNAIGPGEIDQGALSNAIMACAKADRWEEGVNLLHLYGVRTKRFPSLSTVAINSLMSACGRKGRPDVAFGIFNEMEPRYGVKPDVRSYRSVVIACNQAEHQKRRHKEALQSTSPVRAEDAYEGQDFQWWECALALLRRMKENGLTDIQALSSCISACEAAGQWQRAVGVLQSVIDESSKDERLLNLFCFNAAISACEKGGAWVEALEIYERLISYGGVLRPNFVTLSSLVLALDKAGQKELAESKYQQGLKMKIVNPWKVTRDVRGRSLKAMDLHKFNSAMACSAVRNYFDPLLARGETSEVLDDLVVIVGKGLRSTAESKLLPAIRELLLQEYGIEAGIDQENAGRVIVDAQSIRDLVKGRSWR